MYMPSSREPGHLSPTLECGDASLDLRTKDQDLTSRDLGPASLAPSMCMPTFCPPGPNTAEVPLPGGCFFLSQICSQTLKIPRAVRGPDFLHLPFL